MDVLWVSTQAAALVHRLTKHLNKTERDQANRAAESMALNTAEGLGFTALPWSLMMLVWVIVIIRTYGPVFCWIKNSVHGSFLK